MAGAKTHSYHILNPSSRPLMMSMAVLILAAGAIGWMHKTGWGMPAFFAGLAAVAAMFFLWWKDVVHEANTGDHTPVVQLHHRYGMILFIASEVMFFVAWFWVFFEMVIFHDVRAEWMVPTWDAATTEAWANWPPPHVETFDPFHLPLINTLILLLSGTTVTWAHHAMQTGDRNGARNGLILTVLLGAIFTWVQFAIEYPLAGFAFGNNEHVTNANIYGASFFMATGFHGFHVIIGTIFLAICLLRVIIGQMTPQKHFGLEAAAW